MKRILSTLLCLTLLGCTLTLPTQAASPSLGLSCQNTCAAGETFTVDVTANDITNCCAVAFHITYDPTLVEVTDVTKADTLSSWLLVDNYIYAPGELAVALSGSDAKDLSGVIATVSFTAKSSAQGSVSLSLTSLDAVTPSSTSLPLTGGSQTVSITPMEQALLTVTPAPGENGQLVLNVDLTQASYYCGLSFILSYDATHYTIADPVNDVVKGKDFAASLCTVNPNYDSGQVFVSILFATPTCINGRPLTLNLTPIDGATDDADEVTVKITNYVDSSYEKLDIDWAYHPGIVTELDCTDTSLSATVNLVNSAPTAQDCTAFMALYSSDGKFLSLTTQPFTLPAGSCGTASLTMPNDSAAHYIRFFFLDDSYSPISADIRRDLSGT